MYIETHKFGILEVDGTGLVTSFLEKPSPDSTSSRMAVRSLTNSMPLIYYLKFNALSLYISVLVSMYSLKEVWKFWHNF